MLAILKKYTLPDVLLLLLLITLPLPEHWNSKALLLITVFVLFRFSKEIKISFPKIAWLYLLLFLFSSISYFWSEDKSLTLKAIVGLLPFLLFSIGYKQFFAFKNLNLSIRISSIVFLLYGFIWLIFGYFRFTETQNIETFFYHDLTSPFGANAIYIAMIFGLIYIFLLNTILFKKDNNKILDSVLSTFLFAFQFLLSSKLILSILIVITLLFLIKYFKTIRLNRRIVTLSVILSIVFIGIFGGLSSFTKNRFKKILDYKQIENVFEKEHFGPGYYWNGLTLRLFQIRSFFEIEKEKDFNSIAGTGLKASQAHLNKKYEEYDLYRGPSGKGEDGGYFVYNFHNQYTQLLIELGILGGILILLMLYFFVLYPITNKNILLFSVGLLFISLALTETFLFRQKGIVSFVLFPLLAIQTTIKDKSIEINY